MHAAIGVKKRAGNARGGITAAVMSKPIAAFPDALKISIILLLFVIL